MCASEVCVVNATNVLGVRSSVETEDEARGFLPIGAFGMGVEEPKIDLRVRKVVVGDGIRLRRSVLQLWWRPCRHGVISQRLPRPDRLG